MDWLTTLQNEVHSLGLLGVFLIMVIENLAIPIPTEAGFIVAQSLIVMNKITYFEAIAVITAGHTVGAVIAYGIGKWGGRKVEKRFANNAKWINAKKRLDQWFKKWGALTILITRNFGYVRPWSSIIAGIAEYPFLPFLFWTVIGSLIFSAVTLYVTKYIVYIWTNYPDLHIIISIIFAILFFGIIFAEIGKHIYEKVRSARSRLHKKIR